jgi:hypothetical protein
LLGQSLISQLKLTFIHMNQSITKLTSSLSPKFKHKSLTKGKNKNKRQGG